VSDLLPATGDLYSVGSAEKRWKALFLHNYLQAKKSLEMMEVGVDEPYIDWVVPFIRLYDSAIGGTLWLYSNHYDRFGLAYNTGLPNFDLISDLMMYVPAEDKFYFDKQLGLQSGFTVTGGFPDFAWNNSKRFSHENRNTDPNPPVDIGNHEGAIWFRNDLRILKYLAYINYADPNEYEIRKIPYGDDVADLYARKIVIERTDGTKRFMIRPVWWNEDVLGIFEQTGADLADLQVRHFYPAGSLNLSNNAEISSTNPSATYYLKCGNGSIWLTIAAAVGGTDNAYLRIDRAGDITFLDDKFLKVGKDSDGALPAASASYRGKMIRVEGGSGTPDRLYMCMKKADDSYEWTQVASG